MLRRVATTAAAAMAVGALALATAAPAMADPDIDVGHTKLWFDAGPEPAHAHRPLYLGGKLQVRCEEDYIDGFVSVHHADSCEDYERWHRLAGKKIHILFLPRGEHRWEYVDTTRTRRDGSFHLKVPAYWSGTWKAVFDGARGLAPASATDYVKVIRH
ncbi:hypothetical protein HNP84_005632 [Thermocatellispora tengchongensis]|uniref:Secreted protein n=1 Tax=Thermocatellispora tengchongensis TaxID=1073253 RepID=A0A840P891_9ACTN|nr:hypothetical protein [Thermocatellispora tengchongensis]MBB5135888.1 hypothetical protein [Thermocatellispora tengchongensis]